MPAPDLSQRPAPARDGTSGRIAPEPCFLLTRCMLAMAGVSILFSAGAEQEIPNVLVTDRRIDRADEIRGSKIALPASDIPLSAERIDVDTIERTGFAQLGTLLQSTSSVVPNPSDSSTFNDYLLRGFANTPIYRNGINDAIGDKPARVLANVASIEVLKGPVGALYGPGEPGGSIDFITKRPLPRFATDVTFGLGSYSDASFELDSTGPLDRGRSLNYRFIARREQGDTFRDFVKSDRLFVNPMLSWQATGRVRYDVSFEYLTDERLFDNGVVAVEGGLPLPRDRFLGEPDNGSGEIDAYTFALSSAITLADAMELELTLNGQKATTKGRTVEPEELIVSDDRVTLIRSATDRSDTSQGLILQAELSGDTVLRALPHHYLLGASAMGINEDTLFRASDPDDDPYAIDIFAPHYGAASPLVIAERDSNEKSRQFSVYAQDLLELASDWRLLLGLRFDHIDQSGSDLVSRSRFERISNELSPRVGLVFKPDPRWSLFASYSGSIDPNEGLTPSGSSLAPTRSEALETGVKWTSSSYPVSIDASVFAIKQTNVTTEAPGNPGFELQTGKQESIGADFEIRTQPAEWLSVTGRYGFVDAQILQDLTIPDGTTPLNVAKHQFGVLALAAGTLVQPNDLSFAVTLNYLSERQGSLEPGELTLKLPGYFRGDLFITWQQSDALGLRFGIENFTDEDYIQGSQSDGLHLVPGAPLSVQGQLELSF